MKKEAAKNTKVKTKSPKIFRKRGLLSFFIGLYSNTTRIIFQLIFILLLIIGGLYLAFNLKQKTDEAFIPIKQNYWLLLHRKSEKEFLYYGNPGEKEESTLLKTFQVKAGVPGERPTPLPQALGRKYWLITDKFETKDSFETAPYFLKLDIPYSDEFPYGPTPYLECNGQCDWILPGSFGLHGINGDPSRISPDNPGSSGCVRHKDEDITYLYNLLDLKKEKVRYYIEDI